MGFTNSNDGVMKITSLKRWQRDWINQRRDTINYSGLVQEMIVKIIKNEDIDYYKKHSKDIQTPNRNEVTQRLLNL